MQLSLFSTQLIIPSGSLRPSQKQLVLEQLSWLCPRLQPLLLLLLTVLHPACSPEGIAQRSQAMHLCSYTSGLNAMHLAVFPHQLVTPSGSRRPSQ